MANRVYSGKLLVLRLAVSVILGSMEGLAAFREVSTIGKEDGSFEKMTVDTRLGSVYTAGKNTMGYHHFPRYEQGNVVAHSEVHSVIPDCSNKTRCHEHSKGLAIDYANEQLIACWNIPEGSCQKRNLSAPFQVLEHSMIPMVPLDNTSSSVILVADGPTGDQALYIAATRSTEGSAEVKAQIPAISIRNISTFDFLSANNSAAKSWLEVRQDVQEMYRVDYIYGFAHNGFVYFVTNQQGKYGSYVTKLARVCQKQIDLIQSYAELTLRCKSDSEDYNLAMSAFYHQDKQGGENGASPCGGSTLLVAASVSSGTTTEPTQRSAVCQYRMKDIEQAFRDNIQACFRGEGHTGPAHVTQPQQCQQTDITIPLDYCGTHNMNSPVDGQTPLTGEAHLESTQETYTAVAAMETTAETDKGSRRYVVTFIGTDKGKVYMFGGLNKTRTCGSYEYDKIEEEKDTYVPIWKDGKDTGNKTKVTEITYRSEVIKQIDLGHGTIEGHIFVMTSRAFSKMNPEVQKSCPYQEECEAVGTTGSARPASCPSSLYSLLVLVCLMSAHILSKSS